MNWLPRLGNVATSRRGPICLGRRVSSVAFWLASLAMAQPGPKASPTADGLFEQGKAALKAGDWNIACEKFHHSLLLDPSASTLVKIARCHEHGGQLKAAVADYEQALSLISARPLSDQHVRDLWDLVRNSRQAALARLGRLRVRWLPEGNQVRLVVDGEPIDANAAPAEIPVDPGNHTLTLNAAGFDAETVGFDLGEGESREVVLQLKPNLESRPPLAVTAPRSSKTAMAADTPRAAASVPSKSPLARAVVTSSRGRGQRVVALVSGSSGVILLGVAAYLGYRTRSQIDEARVDNHCDGNYACDATGMGMLSQARTTQTEAILFAAGGSVLLATGIVLFVTAPSGHAPTGLDRPRLTLKVGAGGAFVGGQW
jgi:hypothetical protein